MIGLLFESVLKKHFKGDFKFDIVMGEDGLDQDKGKAKAEEVDPAFMNHQNNRRFIEQNIR